MAGVHGRVRLGRGVVIELESGDRIACDGTDSAGATVVSHAHTDHLIGAGAAPFVCSDLTADLARVRRDRTLEDCHEEYRTDRVRIELLEAGHVAGSRAACIEDRTEGTRYLYTGDVSTRDRLYLDGFEPVPADVLIIEATYGRPRYRFPDTHRVIEDIHSWLAAAADRVAILFGYPLGRAQKLQLIAASGPAADRRRFVSPTIAAINGVIADHGLASFAVEPYDAATEFRAGDVIITSGTPTNSTLVNRISETLPVVTAGVSGWAVDDGFKYRGGYDVTFPLSDHCDFSELVDIVTAVDPSIVYTHHGFASDFAQILWSDYGYRAQPLLRHQTTLADF